MDLQHVRQHIDRIYAELAELKRQVILQTPPDASQQQAWHELMAVSQEVSRLWFGPDAVAEIRSQREK